MRVRLLPLLLTALLAGCQSTPSPAPKDVSAPHATVVPGPQEDGAMLLPNQWSLRPAGQQIVVGDFPVNLTVHPSGRYAAVLHCGYGLHEIAILDLRSLRLLSRHTVDEAFYGLTFSPAGDVLYASGASLEAVHVFDFKNGDLLNRRAIRLRDLKEKGVPAGLAIDADAQRLWVANLLGHSVTEVNLATDSVALEVRLSDATNAGAPANRMPTGNLDEDAITKRAEALLQVDGSSVPYPYACVVDSKRQRLYVSLWAQAAVQVIDLKFRQPIARWATEEHPCEMVLSRSGQHLFVANANRNTVTVFDTDSGQVRETLVASLEPNAPPGSTPCSLALSPNEQLLFVANANINAIAVFNVSTPGRSQSLGFIPVGWYPTSVRVTPAGTRLLVANGKGLLPKPNRHGPQPGREAPASVREYIGGLLTGTVSAIELPERGDFAEQMRAYTAQCLRCRPELAQKETATIRDPGNPVPAQVGEPSPIRYCLYILKENRTYDQVLGDMREGNGDPSLCLFPEKVTPNHHQLAREFGLLDNFYVESEVSADGHEWSLGAYATDFVEKMWPMSYGHNQRGKYSYPSEGRFPIAVPAGGYLWDRAREAGVSYRSYGEFVNNPKTTNEPCTTLVTALKKHFDPWFRSFDMDYSDLARADRFISELQRFEREGEMPRLQIVRLPNDHTAGTGVGKLTPTAYVAQNDLALGRVVEAVSCSKFWPHTAIFVVEDDAQNGPDHVDAHRTIAYVISPYSRRNAVDSTLYSTASMLRTMELILGLKPMSQFDAAAMPMFRSFQGKRDLRPYAARPAQVDLTERNSPRAWGGKESGRMNFAKEDAADDLRLNEVIWRSVKGSDHPMPAPVRAGFVLARGEDED